MKVSFFLLKFPLSSETFVLNQIVAFIEMGYEVEIDKILASCELTIGTCLHLAIISMNFGTPAIAIDYEHKLAGIM